MPFETINAIKKLEEQERTEGKLPPLMEFYKALLKIQDRVGQEIQMPNPAFSAEAVTARLRSGKPLLGFKELYLDWTLVRRTYSEVVSLFEKFDELFGPLPQEIKNLTPGRVINHQTLRAWYMGEEIKLPVDMDESARILLRNIFHATIKPFLIRHAIILSELVENEIWRRGYCPICGGNSDFSYIAKETSARWLVCSRCDTEWLFQRIQCPYCGATDQKNMTFYTDDSGLYRLYVCEDCKHYIKAIDLRKIEEDVLFPLERLTTLDIDRQAIDKGYSPCN